MDISDLIGPRQVALDLRARDKAQLLQELGRRASPFVGVDAGAIAAALQAREQLGSTGLGGGFALPHARLDGLRDAFGLFARLARPVPFDSIDERPVDLVAMLLVPAGAAGQHLAALAAISRRMRDRSVADGLRRARDAEAAYRLLVGA